MVHEFKQLFSKKQLFWLPSKWDFAKVITKGTDEITFKEKQLGKLHDFPKELLFDEFTLSRFTISLKSPLRIGPQIFNSFVGERI